MLRLHGSAHTGKKLPHPLQRRHSNERGVDLARLRARLAWAYVSYSISLNDAEQAPLHGLDLLVLGTAYYEETAPIGARSLYDMLEAVELVDVIRPARTVFTHLSHGVDRRISYELPDGITIGYDGLRVPIP